MPTATYTGVILAPPEEVFAFVADAENNPAWHEHVRETRWTDEGPTRIGRRGRQLGHLGGRDWAFVAEVAEWDPPSHVTFQVIEGFGVRTSISVEPAGARRVPRDAHGPDAAPPGPRCGRLGEPPDEGRHSRSRERGFRRLSEALEHPAVR